MKQYLDAFNQYVSQFDLNDGRVNLKIDHTLKVCEIMNQLSSSLHLDLHLSSLAYLCALFHDIARFIQVTQYNTFIDALSFDHGTKAVEIMKEEGFLNDLDSKDQLKILTAIYDHNKYQIGEVKDQETLLLCQMIRDADKIDILRVFKEEDMVNTMAMTIEEVSKQTISQKVYETILSHQCINKDDRTTGLDKWIGFLGFIYDINFKESLEIIKKKDDYRYHFLNTDFKNRETKKQIEIILNDIEVYIKNKVEEKIQ